MAEAEQVVFDRPVPGAVKCAARGCENYFLRAGNRHRYCKAPNCTYKRGAPTPLTLDGKPLSVATSEVLLRLQDEDDGEVGPEMLARRRAKVVEAMRERDLHALSGALIDEATACIWWADRAEKGQVPRRSETPPVPGTTERAASAPGGRPVGLMQAVIASHQRTYDLAEHRHGLLWELLKARDELGSAEYGVKQMAGSPQEEDAQVVLAEKREAYVLAERAMEAAESAWRERSLTLRELTRAAQSMPAQAA